MFIKILMTFISIVLVSCSTSTMISSSTMEWIHISQDGKGFELGSSQQGFVPWGVNYDHNADVKNPRLLEEYWETGWAKIEQDFRYMKKMGANVVRLHLQLGKFMQSRVQPNEKSLAQLEHLVRLAEEVGLYLDITGLGCYRKADVPDWYDALSEKERWAVQARFWSAVASRCAKSPAIFCYDLMNEPTVAVGEKWLVGKPLGEFYFVQNITLERGSRAASEVALQWIRTLKKVIRQQDAKHFITVGVFNLPGNPGLCLGCLPKDIAGELDFLCTHQYPKESEVDAAVGVLKHYAVGKPVVIEEMFPLNCSAPVLKRFIEASRKYVCGWLGFYWGKTLEECQRSPSVGDALMVSWLELFQSEGKTLKLEKAR